MPLITFIAVTGRETTIDVPAGTTLMKAAVFNRIQGIVGECGGSMMCGTCHVYVDEAWLARLPRVEDEEDEMLNATYCPREDNSRLSCQLAATEELDGLVVRMPESQI